MESHLRYVTFLCNLGCRGDWAGLCRPRLKLFSIFDQGNLPQTCLLQGRKGYILTETLVESCQVFKHFQ